MVMATNPQQTYSRRRSHKAIIMALVFMLSNNFLGLAYAAETADTEEQKRRIKQEAQERIVREQQKDVSLSRIASEGEDTSLPTEETSFRITKLVLEGEQAEKFAWAQAMLDKYAGKKIGREGITLIVKRLTNAFIARGYVTTRIGIPEQELVYGCLRLTLIPGIVREVRFAGDDNRNNWRTAFPLRQGDLLNLRDIEQGLEQLKRLPSQDADIQIVPGAKPGESDLVVTMKHSKPVRAVLSIDDSGSLATGKMQSAATMYWDNPFTLNDTLNMSLNGDLDRDGEFKGTRGYSFNYSMPYGYWTFSLSGSSYDYHQTVAGSQQNFISSGNNHNLEFRADKIMQRSQTYKTGLEMRVVRRNSRSYIDDTEILVQHKDVTSAELGINHRRYKGQAVIDTQLAYRQGVPWFNAQPEEDAGTASPTTRYQLWVLDTNVVTPVKLGSKKGRYTLNFRAQTTNDILYASEQFSIGSRYTVRGFDGEHTLAAENGWYVRNELSMPIGLGQEIYIGLDHGAVSGPSAAALPGRSLTGMVFGLRFSKDKMNCDLFTGWPLAKPAGFNTANPVLGFQLIYQL